MEKLEKEVELLEKSNEEVKRIVDKIKTVEIPLKPKQLFILTEIRKDISILQQTISLQEAKERDIVAVILENNDINSDQVGNIRLADNKIIITYNFE